MNDRQQITVPTWGAFAMFGNHDENGARFEDTSVKVTNFDTAQTSAHESTATGIPRRTTVLLISKILTSLSQTLDNRRESFEAPQLRPHSGNEFDRMTPDSNYGFIRL